MYTLVLLSAVQLILTCSHTSLAVPLMCEQRALSERRALSATTRHEEGERRGASAQVCHSIYVISQQPGLRATRRLPPPASCLWQATLAEESP